MGDLVIGTVSTTFSILFFFVSCKIIKSKSAPHYYWRVNEDKPSIFHMEIKWEIVNGKSAVVYGMVLGYFAAIMFFIGLVGLLSFASKIGIL